MPFINGRWVDEEEARKMMMQQQMEGMISPVGSFGPSPIGPTTYTPQPDYGAWPGRIGVEPPTPSAPVPMPPPVMQTIENFAQPSGMLTPTSVNPLQAFTEPSFTQPLAALNRQATQAFSLPGRTPQAAGDDRGDPGTFFPGEGDNVSNPGQPGLWPWPPGEDPVTDDKGPGSGWRPGFGTQRDVYAPQPEDDAGDDFFGDGDVSGDYSLSSAGFSEMDRGAMLAAMGPQAYSPPAHIQDRQMQAPQVQAPVPQMQAPQRQAPAPFVAPTYTAPTAPAPIDIDAIRSTVTAPAPFDFSDVSGGRLAEARKYAGQGMFGRAKQQIELGGGDWSTAMHRALRGETGMSPAELEQAKNAAVQQATRAREAQHAANVLAAQKRHAAKAKGAAAKRAAAAKVAAAQQAVIDSQMAAEAAARLKQQQAASAAAAKAAADKVAARRAAATAAATAAAQSSADNTSYQDRMRQMAIDVEAALAAAATAASEDRDSDYNTGSFGPFSKEAIKELFEFVTGEDYGTYDEQQDFIENMRSSGLLSAKQAEQFKGMHLSEWSPFLNTVSAPVQIWDQISDTDWTGYKQFWDAVKTGGKSTFNQLIGGMQQQAGVPYPDIFGDHYGYSDSGMGEQEGSGHPGMR